MELFQYLVDKEKYFGMNIQCYFSRVAIILTFVSFVSIRPTVSIRPVLRYLLVVLLLVFVVIVRK